MTTGTMWTFENLYDRFAAKQFGTPDATQTAEAKEIVQDAVMLFCGERAWTFLVQPALLTLTLAGDGVLAMPDDFSEIEDDPILTDTNRSKPPRLIQRTVECIDSYNAQINDVVGPPCYYAIREAAWSKTIGSRKEIITAPKADTDYAVSLRYRMQVTVPVNDDDYPMGCPTHGPTILQCAKMLYEQKKNVTGQQTVLYYGERTRDANRIRGALERSIERDRAQRPGDLGPSGPPRQVVTPPRNVTYETT